VLVEMKVVDGVEGARGCCEPAGVMDGGKGGGAVADVRLEGDAIEGVDVGGVIVAIHGADAGWRRRNVHVDVGRNGDGGEVDVVGVAKLDVEVVLPAVVDGGVGDPGSVEFGGEGYPCAVEREGVVGEGDRARRAMSRTVTSGRRGCTRSW
jgi:hypothetical protein